MSETVKVRIPAQSEDRSYPVIIGADILSSLPKLFDCKNYSSALVISDKAVEASWGNKVRESLTGAIPVQAIVAGTGEASKSVDSISSLWKGLIAGKADRKSLVINVGGGALGDAGGFAASTYMRGLDFVQIPTTLLSQVDASVGGKLGIDFDGIKNIVGSISQPRAVIIDVSTLTTLPEREFQSGFSEILKHGLIKDQNYFSDTIANLPNRTDSARLAKLVKRSVEIKAAVVESDERESGPRKILNFGHTIGHALESLSHQPGAHALLHGEAIGWGMLIEAKISVLKGLLQASEFDSIIAGLKQAKLLPALKIQASVDEILKISAHDKKNVGGEIRWTLLERIGNAVFDQRVEEKVVREALSLLNS